MTIHTQLADAIGQHYGERLTQPPQLTQDALTLAFDSGLLVQLRFANADEYSIQWSFDGRELRIDTAPLHPGLTSFPNHLHDADGTVRADTLTRPGRAPWENLQAVLDSLLGDAPR
jgi:hypothetical protein